ncbi:MAG: ABC transporter permease [Verrucomicrobiaceae bacterium]
MKRRTNEFLLTLPSMAWLAVFFFIPAIIVLVLACKPADAQGGVGAGWTLENFRALADPQYLPIIWRTFWISAVSSVICVVIALPAACAIARANTRRRNLLLLLVLIPFWTNFLVRIFAWKSLLHPDGIVEHIATALHLVEDGEPLLYNSFAVLLVMIYTQLPFAILPIYAAAEKFDFTLIEAARDLGASKLRTVVSVLLPGISRGIGVAAVMVFVAAIGMYVVPDIVGGADSEMIGNKIAQRVQSDRNLPLASALAAAMLGGVILLLVIARCSTYRLSVNTQDTLKREHLT